MRLRRIIVRALVDLVLGDEQLAGDSESDASVSSMSERLDPYVPAVVDC